MSTLLGPPEIESGQESPLILLLMECLWWAGREDVVTNVPSANSAVHAEILSLLVVHLNGLFGHPIGCPISCRSV